MDCIESDLNNKCLIANKMKYQWMTRRAVVSNSLLHNYMCHGFLVFFIIHRIVICSWSLKYKNKTNKCLELFVHQVWFKNRRAKCRQQQKASEQTTKNASGNSTGGGGSKTVSTSGINNNNNNNATHIQSIKRSSSAASRGSCGSPPTVSVSAGGRSGAVDVKPPSSALNCRSPGLPHPSAPPAVGSGTTQLPSSKSVNNFHHHLGGFFGSHHHYHHTYQQQQQQQHDEDGSVSPTSSVTGGGSVGVWKHHYHNLHQSGGSGHHQSLSPSCTGSSFDLTSGLVSSGFVQRAALSAAAVAAAGYYGQGAYGSNGGSSVIATGGTVGGGYASTASPGHGGGGNGVYYGQPTGPDCLPSIHHHQHGSSPYSSIAAAAAAAASGHMLGSSHVNYSSTFGSYFSGSGSGASVSDGIDYKDSSIPWSKFQNLWTI